MVTKAKALPKKAPTPKLKKEPTASFKKVIPVTVKIEPKWSKLKAKMLVRADSSDTDVIEEVITKRCYRKPTIGMEILPGEHWLDLGANIGTFAVCCFLHKATATCFEPVSSCFDLLKKNVPWKGFVLRQYAVSAKEESYLPAWESKNPLNFYRTTIIPTDAYQKAEPIPNLYVGMLATAPGNPKIWDGIKLDIEGSELEMIDKEILPKTEKLALEYHFSRDNKSMKNFHRRMKLLRKIFDTVSYSPSLDNQKDGTYPGRFDIMVHCTGRK